MNRLDLILRGVYRKFAWDCAATPCRMEHDALMRLEQGWMFLDSGPDAEEVDLVRALGLLPAFCIAKQLPQIAYTVDLFCNEDDDGELYLDTAEEMRAALQEIAGELQPSSVRDWMDRVYRQVLERWSVQALADDMLYSKGMPAMFMDSMAILKLLHTTLWGCLTWSAAERAEPGEIQCVRKLASMARKYVRSLDEMIQRARQMLVQQYGEHYLRRAVQSGKARTIEMGSNDTLPLREAMLSLAQEDDPARCAVVNIALEELADYEALSHSTVALTAHRTVLFIDSRGRREMRLGKAAAYISKFMQNECVQVVALPAVLPVLGEIRIGLDDLTVELYLGEQCGEAYRQASLAGIRSCMANEHGIGAMRNTAMGLDRAMGVLLFRKNGTGKVVARCRVYVVFCTSCGRTMTFADRQYVGDTRYSTTVEGIRSAIVECRHPSTTCCGGALARPAAVYVGPQPYEDTFRYGYSPVAGTTFAMLTSQEHNWQRYTPEEALRAILDCSLEEMLRMRYPAIVCAKSVNGREI